MLSNMFHPVIGTLCLAVLGSAYAASLPTAPPAVAAHSIGGTVSGPAGPEAGVWVIAETSDLPSRFMKIVVTDDQGRFVLPDMPKAKFKVWSRGYGLLDSAPVEAVPKQTVRLQPARAESPAQAAQIYPASYWFSLIHVPPANEFPGTGASGNGISPAMKTQEHWISHMKENCEFCHQLGTKVTRELPNFGNPVDSWNLRIQKQRNPDDPFFAGDPTHAERNFAERMSNLMTLFGRQRGLEMYADWTTRIAQGEVPPAPSRPIGVERDVVITIWDMGGGRFFHDNTSTDKRNSTLNADGPVYGTATYSGMILSVDPKTGKEEDFKMTDASGNWGKNILTHTGTMDSKGRIWASDLVQYGNLSMGETGPNPTFCTDPGDKFAKYFPRDAKQAKLVSVFDPKTKTNTVIPVCFGTHHLNFDKNERLYFSGDTEVVGWIDVAEWDRTKDLSKAEGWCPFVLDTNGDGQITPDRTQWNEALEGAAGGEGSDLKGGAAGNAASDPNKDTRIAGFNYGMAVSPKDQSYWAAKYSPLVPSGIIRVDPGANPPLTCKTEYYEPPKINGGYRAFNVRGVDVDADGIAWVAFGSGAIGRFDRSQCQVRNGPTATGQQCPEGWEIIDTPGPKLSGTAIGTDWMYLTDIDHYNYFGLGKDVPFFPNSVGDELLAYLPKEKRFVHLRVPYPLGFYARSLDGRIDDPKAGWKGRGLWTGNSLVAVWHQETGEKSSLYVAHFQLRPTPLAN
jgi:hypothetical protein